MKSIGRFFKAYKAFLRAKTISLGAFKASLVGLIMDILEDYFFLILAATYAALTVSVARTRLEEMGFRITLLYVSLSMLSIPRSILSEAHGTGVLELFARDKEVLYAFAASHFTVEFAFILFRVVVLAVLSGLFLPGRWLLVVFSALLSVPLLFYSSLGVGLISSANYYYIDAREDDPFLTVYEVFFPLFTGVMFDLAILPYPLNLVSVFLPHTYAVDLAIRLAGLECVGVLSIYGSLDPLLVDLAGLFVVGSAYGVVGALYFKKALKIAVRRGKIVVRA